MLRVHWHHRAQTFKCFNSAADEQHRVHKVDARASTKAKSLLESPSRRKGYEAA